MSDLSSALFSSDSVPPFVPTSQWAPILAGQSVPAGLWMRMDISTGMRMARLMPQPGEQRVEGEQQPPAEEPQQQQRASIRDDDFDESIPAANEGTTADSFFSVYAGVFERNAKFSKSSQSNNLITLRTFNRVSMNDQATRVPC